MVVTLGQEDRNIVEYVVSKLTRQRFDGSIGSDYDAKREIIKFNLLSYQPFYKRGEGQ